MKEPNITLTIGGKTHKVQYLNEEDICFNIEYCAICGKKIRKHFYGHAFFLDCGGKPYSKKEYLCRKCAKRCRPIYMDFIWGLYGIKEEVEKAKENKND